jgi:hypothetical protein
MKKTKILQFEVFSDNAGELFVEKVEASGVILKFLGVNFIVEEGRNC